jgi:prepilin-type N-terminal cleavage/methylation domain-containing protein
MSWYNSKSSAFTLIELIIVVAIIALLAAAAFLVINPGKRMGDSKDSRRWQDLVSLSKAVEMYTADNGHYLQT